MNHRLKSKNRKNLFPLTNRKHQFYNQHLNMPLNPMNNKNQKTKLNNCLQVKSRLTLKRLLMKFKQLFLMVCRYKVTFKKIIQMKMYNNKACNKLLISKIKIRKKMSLGSLQMFNSKHKPHWNISLFKILLRINKNNNQNQSKNQK